ncbi:hypothetical protein, partial [Pantoea sp. Pa-EAmG]|uniref:hypothetical protein n=1 Tax=Pantoea sp. Pa-EAmG TaxID=3043311 RepID=UPI0024AFE8BF
IILFALVETSNESLTACSDRGFQDCSVTLRPAPTAKNGRKAAGAPQMTGIKRKALEITGSKAIKKGTASGAHYDAGEKTNGAGYRRPSQSICRW